MSRSTYRARAPIAFLLPASVSAVVAAIPLAYIVVRASQGGVDGIRREIVSSRTLHLLTRSVTLALSVTVACAFLGTACALLVTRTDMKGKSVLGVAFAAPLAIPTYVAAYTWLATTGLNGFRGSFVVLTTCCYPYVYIPVRAAMTRIDGRQSEVARSLGVGAATTFWRVTIPQLRSAIGSGSLLVTLYVLSDFGAVSLMRHDVFTTSIFLSYQGSFDRTPAAILGCLLAVITGFLVWGESAARKDNVERSAKGAVRRPTPVRLGRWSIPCWGFAVGVLGTSLGVPLVTLIRWSGASPSDPVTFQSLTSTVWATVGISLLGAVVTTLLALPVAVLVSRYRSRSAKAIEAATNVGHALPGLVIALALVFFGVRFATPIYQRLPLLIGAYAVLFLPLAIGAIRSSLASAPIALDEVGRSLGIGPAGVVRRVVLPLAAPGIGAGAVMVFLTCIKELPATLLLRPTGLDTLATRLWSETSVADYGRAAPYAIAIVVVASVPTLILTSLSLERAGGRTGSGPGTRRGFRRLVRRAVEGPVTSPL